ncbi:unnamed protein product [Rhizoctonia solani]|uniref:Protein transport protein SFT2 n=1 Tax=Rhizoctonia solani TaxID=456999 RepID=A0A8H3HRI7_9AGAM|nr:unnamed protein product [Rhizoctonia solani]CAE7074226.1 unnamed protein product [Rhizoctonia solani]
MPKGWLNLEGVTDTQVFENEPAFNFGLSRTQRLYGFVGCLAIGFVLSILGSCLLFVGALGSFALLYTIGIIVSLIGTGFLIGFGKQLQLMFKPVRVVATIIFLATIGLVFVGAFVIKIAFLCLIFVIIEYLAYTWYCLSYNTWFYINTLANPPRSQWLHPSDHHDQNNPPHGGVNWNALGPAGGTPAGGYGPGGDRGYDQGGYNQGGYNQGGYNPGMQQGYPPPQVQHKSSSNTGAIVAAGAAGVVGGALIANALSDDDYQDGYEAGLEAAEEEN